MAAAIAFNVLVAFVPLLLLVVGIAGFFISARFPDPGDVIVPLLVENVPAGSGGVDLAGWIHRTIDGLVADRTGLSVVGAVVFIWLSTRLVGTLRTALREVFDIAHDRGIIRGKLFDAQVVLVGGVLFLVNVGVTVTLKAAGEYGIDVAGLQGSTLDLSREILALTLAFISVWALFVLVYRYLTPRSIPWRTALVAGTFTAIIHESMKVAFSWYATSVADFRSAYGNLTTVVLLLFWIYYESLGFILGGEVSQVYTMQRARKRRLGKAPAPLRVGEAGSDGG